jgi:hypothetical protein
MAVLIKAKMLDGREVQGESSTFMCAADRMAFERRFGVGAAVMQPWQRLYDSNGDPVEGADLSEVREEYVNFFAWRALRRLANGQLPEDWDVFSDTVQEISTEELPAEEAGLDPTSSTSVGLSISSQGSS